MSVRVEGFGSRFVGWTAHAVAREVTVKSMAAVLRDWTGSLCFDTPRCMFSPRVQRGASLLPSLGTELESCNRGRGNSLSHDANGLGRRSWAAKVSTVRDLQIPDTFRDGPPYCAGADQPFRDGC